MNDFEVLSRDVAESVAPVEPKRDAETPQEPETVRRVRVGLDVDRRTRRSERDGRVSRSARKRTLGGEGGAGAFARRSAKEARRVCRRSAACGQTIQKRARRGA